MGDTDLATSWDLVPATKQVIMQEDRDFSYPREPLMVNDIHSAEDGEDPFIKQVQIFLSGKPLGVRYSGSLNGKLSQPVIDSLVDFQYEVSKKTGKSVSIVNGTKINQSAFWSAVKSLKEEEPVSETTTKSEKSEVSSKPSLGLDVIKSFQSFLSTSHPVIGAPYHGPVDGIPNAELIAAAKSVESIISKAIGKGAGGMLWNDSTKTFNTSTKDLNEAVNLIAKHTEKKSSSNLTNVTKMSRFQALFDVVMEIEKK